MRESYTVYSTGLVAIAGAAGAAANASVTLEAGTDFEVHFLSGIATQANVIVTNWAGTVQVSFNQPQTQTFFNIPVAFMEVAGDGRQLYPLRKPQLIKGNTVLAVAFANSAAGTATSASLSFHGYRVPSGRVA